MLSLMSIKIHIHKRRDEFYEQRLCCAFTKYICIENDIYIKDGIHGYDDVNVISFFLMLLFVLFCLL